MRRTWCRLRTTIGTRTYCPGCRRPTTVGSDDTAEGVGATRTLAIRTKVMSEETHADELSRRYEVAEPDPNRNMQLYENSPLFGSKIEQDYNDSRDSLYNDRLPNLAVLHEKPEHRIILFLKAQGLSNKEIAEKTEKTPAWISQVLRQPWARRRLVMELQEAGQDAVQSVIKAAALDSVFCLIDQRDNDKAKPAERISAANSLLDRFLGKPTLHVEAKTTVSRGIDEIDELKRDLEKLEVEQKRLTGTRTDLGPEQEVTNGL